MPQRYSKNNNDLAFIKYDEKPKLGYGAQKERLGKDSIKPFDAYCLRLKPFIDPLCCQKGHFFCKECILPQKKDIQRKLAAHAAQQKQEEEEEEEKLILQKARSWMHLISKTMVLYHNTMIEIMAETNGFHGANSGRHIL